MSSYGPVGDVSVKVTAWPAWGWDGLIVNAGAGSGLTLNVCDTLAVSDDADPTPLTMSAARCGPGACHLTVGDASFEEAGSPPGNCHCTIRWAPMLLSAKVTD